MREKGSIWACRARGHDDRQQSVSDIHVRLLFYTCRRTPQPNARQRDVRGRLARQDKKSMGPMSKLARKTLVLAGWIIILRRHAMSRSAVAWPNGSNGTAQICYENSSEKVSTKTFYFSTVRFCLVPKHQFWRKVATSLRLSQQHITAKPHLLGVTNQPVQGMKKGRGWFIFFSI